MICAAARAATVAGVALGAGVAVAIAAVVDIATVAAGRVSRTAQAKGW